MRDGSIREMIAEFRWLLRYALRYKGTILVQLFFSVAGVLFGLCSSIASKTLINSVIKTELSPALYAGAAMVLLSLSSIGMRMLSGRISAKAGVTIRNALETTVFGKILKAKWESLQVYRSGDLLNRLHSDTRTVVNCIIALFPGMISASFQFIGALVIVLYFDAAMALIALIGIPISVLLSRTLLLKLRSYQDKIRKMDSELMSFEEEAFHNVDLVKSLGIIGLFERKLSGMQASYRETYLSHNRLSVSVSGAMSCLGLLVSSGCFCYGAYRLWSGAIDFGTMTLFLQLATSLSGAFSLLTGYIPQLIGTATAVGRIMAVTELPAENEACPQIDPEKGLHIHLSNVSFAYETGTPVLESVCFDASAGMTVGLVGTSGEGKTTFLRLLLGLLDYSGNAVIFDCSGKEAAVSAATRSFVSYVPQDNIMFAGTVAENMRMVKESATDEEIIEALKTACAYDEIISRLPDGINSKIGEKGKGFSEGQIQRFSIARALLKDAPILLLDEATSALDMETEQQVIKNLIRQNSRRICIVSTHRTGALSLCDAVYRVDDTQLTLEN